MTDVRSFAVGPIQENAYLVRASGDATSALLIDPGEEPQRLLEAAGALGVQIEAILLTHCHFDHIGAVAPGVAEALIATAAALSVAIPAVFGYNLFASRLNRFDSQLEGFGSAVIALAVRDGHA